MLSKSLFRRATAIGALLLAGPASLTVAQFPAPTATNAVRAPLPPPLPVIASPAPAATNEAAAPQLPPLPPPPVIAAPEPAATNAAPAPAPAAPAAPLEATNAVRALLPSPARVLPAPVTASSIPAVATPMVPPTPGFPAPTAPGIPAPGATNAAALLMPAPAALSVPGPTNAPALPVLAAPANGAAPTPLRPPGLAGATNAAAATPSARFPAFPGATNAAAAPASTPVVTLPRTPGLSPSLPPLPGMPPAPGATAPPGGAVEAGGQKLISLNFQEAPLDQILTFYGELTGRTMIKAPGQNAVITLRGQTRLTEVEAKQALESVLALNNVTLVPLGDKFFKVVQPATALQESLKIEKTLSGKPLPESDSLISQIIDLKYIEIADIGTVLQGIIHGYGKILPLERTNSLLITDTKSNVQRVLEILEYIDRPASSKVETRIYELHHAEATKVVQQLNELIQDSQTQQKPRTTFSSPTATPAPSPLSPPGIIRAPRPAGSSSGGSFDLDLSERGIVTGRVKMVADERTNVMIIISEPQNFPFFDQMISAFDRAVDPEIIVKVYSLEYADADEAASVLSELIGVSSSSSYGGRTSSSSRYGSGSSATRSGSNSRTGSTTSRTGVNRNTTAESDTRSAALRDFIARQGTVAGAAGGAAGATSGIGEISPNTRILSDKRSNALLFMGRRTDIAVLEAVTKQLDIMLAQVVIEAVVIEVSLNNNTSYGIDWLQRSMVAYEQTKSGTDGGISVVKPVTSFGGGFVSGTASSFIDGNTVDRATSLSSGGLTYYLTMANLNLDAVVRMAASSSDARILSTPIVLTQDNTEAKIIAGEERPIVNATTTTEGGNQTSQYEYRNIGVELTVTPRVNPERMVTMDVKQTADNVGDIVKIDGNDVPVITKRELSAMIAVADRSTIVLGGMVSSTDRKGRTKIPLLGDIPILGRLFRSDSDAKVRTELLVLITPYVVTTPDEARRETGRIHDASNASSSKWYKDGWSDGDLSRERRDIEAGKIPLRARSSAPISAPVVKSSGREIVVPSDPERAPAAGGTNGAAWTPGAMEPPTVIFRSTDVAPSVPVVPGVPAVPAPEAPPAPAAP